jgi:hypothetical protein
MTSGTLMVVWGGFSAVVTIDVLGLRVPAYAAVVALTINLIVAVALTPLFGKLTARNVSGGPFPTSPVRPA